MYFENVLKTKYLGRKLQNTKQIIKFESEWKPKRCLDKQFCDSLEVYFFLLLRSKYLYFCILNALLNF